MTYSEKLRDPRWQKKRLEILNRDNFTCTLCGDDKTELQIHHNVYYKEPWDALNENLTTLCKDCHGAIEKIKKGYDFFSPEPNFIGCKKFTTALVIHTKDVIFLNSILDSSYECITAFKMDSSLIDYLHKIHRNG